MLSAPEFTSTRTRRKLNQTDSQDELMTIEDKIQNVTDKARSLRTLTYETINSHYKVFINTYLYLTDLENEVNSLLDQLEIIENEFSEENNIPPSFENLKNDIGILNYLAKLHSHLQNFDGLVDMGEFISAASSIKEMGEILVFIAETEEGVDKLILNLLKNQFIKKKATLIARLNDLFAQAFVFSPRTNSVPQAKLTVTFRLTNTYAKKYFDNPITIADLFTSSELLGNIDMKAEEFGKWLLDVLIEPIIRSDKEEVAFSSNKLHATLSFGKQSAGSANKTNKEAPPPSPTVFQKLRTLVDFLNEHIFSASGSENQNAFLHAVGSLIGDKLVSLLIDEILIPSIPDDRSEVDGYIDRVKQEILDFEGDLIKLGLISDNQQGLSNFIVNIRTFYAKKRRTNMLTIARDLLISDDMNTVEVTEQVGVRMSSEEKHQAQDANGKAGYEGGKAKEGAENDESDFIFPRCHVSIQTQTLIELAYQTLQDMMTSDETGATELYLATRDMFDLFRAVVPLQHAELLEESPARAMIFYNDCSYIVHHLLTMGYPYRDKLPKTIKETAGFVDMIPLFRDLGKKIFLEMIVCFLVDFLRASLLILNFNSYKFSFMQRKQRDILLRHFPQSFTFRDISSDREYEKIEKIVKSANYQLISLDKTWKPIMPSETYFKTIALLFDQYLSTMFDYVLKLEHISQNQCHPIRYILGLVLKLESLFEKRVSKPKSIAELGKSKASSAAKGRKVGEMVAIPKYSEQYLKFKQLILFLELGSYEVAKEKYNSGMLKELREEEYAALIKKRWDVDMI
ncbi:Centromere/kinetochore Zw10-domain-containing protein [Paraphysoderma sedebokerense]|nr:Centromere/kinetochore Zw10-domain-containing protein [Paraphysoderma sedebokerense]